MTVAEKLISKLKNPALATDKAYIAGAWIGEGQGGKHFDVTNPATGEVVATLPDLGVAETAAAIDKAYVAQKSWAAKTGKERAVVLRKLFDLMVEKIGEFILVNAAVVVHTLETAYTPPFDHYIP